MPFLPDALSPLSSQVSEDSGENKGALLLHAEDIH